MFAFHSEPQIRMINLKHLLVSDLIKKEKSQLSSPALNNTLLP